MFNEVKFKVDIDNIKTDLAMENMTIGENDIDILKSFAKEEINIEEVVKKIKDTPYNY